MTPGRKTDSLMILTTQQRPKINLNITLTGTTLQTRLRRLRTRLCFAACVAAVLTAIAPASVYAGTETTGSPPAAPKTG